MPTWPFPTRDPAQFKRIDDGWDLQAAGTTPVPVLAPVAGTVSVAPPDPAGFGLDYPLLKLDVPVNAGGKTRDTVYFGHTHVIPAVKGQHVAEGTAIAMTGGAHSGGNAASESNWLEIGFWPPSMSNGQAMKDWISSGATGAAGTPPPATGAAGILPAGFTTGVANPSWWFRFAMGVGGAVLALIGSWVLLKDTSAAKSLTRGATKLASVAGGPAGKLAAAAAGR